MKNQPKAFLFGTCLTVAGMLLSPGWGIAQTVQLSNAGSIADVNLGGSNPGMNMWSVPGSSQNELDGQWFWYSVNGGPVQSINTISSSPSYNQAGGNNTLSVMYSDSQLSISLLYVLQGTGMGSASMTESIAVDNNTSSTFTLNLFEYSNFNLLQSGNNTATVFGSAGSGYSQVTQTSGATAISQSISSPFANYAEAGSATGPNTVLGDVISGSNLSGPLTYTGNAAWAFQWNTSLAAQPDEFDELGNGSLSITNVPEPSSFALIGLGLGACGWLRRRRQA
jgi:hypothetical protein